MLTLFMKYILSIIMMFGLIFSQSHTNHFIYPDKCGFHSPNEDEIILENNIKQWLIENPNYNNRNTLNIPIVFHIIYEDNSSDGGYISQTLINNQVDVLNAAFLNANISFSIEPEFTPILIEQLLFFAALITSLILFTFPMFPGFILKHFAPFSAASIALL